MVVPELTPSDCSATKPATNWNSTLFDAIMKDFMVAVCGPDAAKGTCRHSVADCPASSCATLSCLYLIESTETGVQRPAASGPITYDARGSLRPRAGGGSAVQPVPPPVAAEPEDRRAPRLRQGTALGELGVCVSARAGGSAIGRIWDGEVADVTRCRS